MSFDAFVRDFHDHMSRDPNACVEKGIERHQGELPDPSLAHAAATARDARRLLERAAALDEAALAFDDALDLDLARLQLESEIHALELTSVDRPVLELLPRAGHEIGEGIFLLLANDPRPAGDRLVDVTSRIERVPEYLSAMLARVKRPVKRWVDMDLAKVHGLPSLFGTATELAASVGFADRPRLERAVERASAALGEYAKVLGELETTTVFPIGEPATRELVRRRGLELELDELQKIAADFLFETQDELNALAPSLRRRHLLPDDTSIPDLHEFLSEKYRLAVPDKDFAKVLDRYRVERDRILAFVKAHDLFPIPPDQDLEILETPAFMRPSIPAGAMMPPPPFRAGTKRSLIYLTLSEELLDEHTEISIPAMMIHEGIPGHHLHLASAALHPSVVRRHVWAMDQAEGWTTMLEDYMIELGYAGELSEEVTFVTKREISRIGARVAIDLFFMTGDPERLRVGVDAPDLDSDDPFVAAASLLSAVTGFVPERTQAEVSWYSQERGYPLSYLAGNKLVWDLKRDVARQSELKGLELDRAFHRAFLGAGNMPVSRLRRVFRHQGLLVL